MRRPITPLASHSRSCWSAARATTVRNKFVAAGLCYSAPVVDSDEVLLAGEYFLAVEGLAMIRSVITNPSQARPRVDEIRNIIEHFDEFPQSLEFPVKEFERRVRVQSLGRALRWPEPGDRARGANRPRDARTAASRRRSRCCVRDRAPRSKAGRARPYGRSASTRRRRCSRLRGRRCRTPISASDGSRHCRSTTPASTRSRARWR